MQTIRAVARGLGDYLQNQEEVQVVDESTGIAYNLIVKSLGEQPEPGVVRVYVPENVLRDIIVADGYCVLELSNNVSGSDVGEWRRRLKENLGKAGKL